MSLTTDERRQHRTTVEIALLTAMRSMTDDCNAIAETFERFDLDAVLLTRLMDMLNRAADRMKAARQFVESNVRADAIEAATRITQDRQG